MNDALTVLMVEDDRIDQIAFQRLIEQERLHYDYTIASSIGEARAVLESQHFDVIIADYNLSDGTGFDLLPLRGDMPLIFVTGTGDERLAVEAIKAGAADYLTKDMSRNYLSLLPIVVENAVKRRQTDKEAAELMHERIRRKTLQDFIRTASHDLITPLTTLGTSLHLLGRYAERQVSLTQMPETDRSTLEKHATIIAQRCNVISEQREQLEQIIMDLLEMVKVDSLEAVEMEAVDVNRLLTQVVQSMEEHARGKDQILRFVPDDHALTIAAAPLELASVIRKLLRNAIEYTPPRGDITVTAACAGTEAVLSVADTGVGIAETDLPYIFERFYRVNAARTMTTGSSGLGLAIAKQLVALHEGRIEVESRPGAGSVFRVYLPRVIAN
ncbi:MAG: response regulator [Chloroflexi bacterium]|nr:response regulator [Chloroflexota bacterium]